MSSRGLRILEKLKENELDGRKYEIKSTIVKPSTLKDNLVPLIDLEGTKIPEQDRFKRADFLRTVANLRPPNYLRDIETSLFRPSDYFDKIITVDVLRAGLESLFVKSDVTHHPKIDIQPNEQAFSEHDSSIIHPTENIQTLEPVPNLNAKIYLLNDPVPVRPLCQRTRDEQLVEVLKTHLPIDYDNNYVPVPEKNCDFINELPEDCQNSTTILDVNTQGYIQMNKVCDTSHQISDKDQGSIPQENYQDSHQGTSKNCSVLDKDLFLSSDPDPYATVNDSADPDYKMSVNKSKHRKLSISRLQRIKRKISTSSESEDEKEMKIQEVNKFRKTKRCEKEWRRNKIKFYRNLGKKYTTWKGKIHPERSLKDPCKDCRAKCLQNINEEERKQILNAFWNLGDVNRQKDFISRNIQVDTKARCRKRRKTDVSEDDEADREEARDDHSRRNFSYKYFLPKNGNKVKVCKTFFLNTLSISAQVVKTAINKIGSTGIVSEDRRGKVCKNSVVDESVKQSVRDHIDSFEKVESHYCRKKTSRQYLPATLNVSKMYSLYLEHCTDNNISKLATETMYREIFMSEKKISVISATDTIIHHMTRRQQSKRNMIYILKTKI